MEKLLMLFMFMVIAHIIDDYYLQGILANLKQKSFWEQNAPDKLYKDDYKMALLMHGLSWSFMILLPLMIYTHFTHIAYFFALWIGSGLIHADIDDGKANKKSINLITDQILHIVQIITILIVTNFNNIF